MDYLLDLLILLLIGNVVLVWYCAILRFELEKSRQVVTRGYYLLSSAWLVLSGPNKRTIPGTWDAETMDWLDEYLGQ